VSTYSFALARRWRAGVIVVAIAAVVSVIVAMVGFGTRPARADLQNPRQDFLRASTNGLFMHWGMLTSPGFTSCSAWEKAVTGGGWTASYWVNEAQKLHASYITLATFHSKLGYARPWKSSIPGSCSTQRDFLGELISAAHGAGLRVILYMTNDAQWHNLNNHEWFDSAAYSKFKGKTINMDTQDGFGQFSYDNFFDVMKSHPTLDGFWIDNDNNYWLSHNLYQQIYQLHPNMTISNNNEDTPLQGRHPYDVSKSCADLISRTYAQTYGLPVAVTRCGNFYGGGDLNWSRIVPGTIRSFHLGEPPVIRSDGTFVRDYIHVKDVVAAYLCVAEALDRMAHHVDIPFPESCRGAIERENTPLPGFVKNRLVRFADDRPHAVHPAHVVHAVHRWAPPTVTFAVPIIASRDTNAASSSSPISSVPGGRSGSTR